MRDRRRKEHELERLGFFEFTAMWATGIITAVWFFTALFGALARAAW